MVGYHLGYVLDPVKSKILSVSLRKFMIFNEFSLRSSSRILFENHVIVSKNKWAGVDFIV